jgi:hypothetical protein
MDSLREALWSSEPPPGSDLARERVIRSAVEELGLANSIDRGPMRRRILAVAAGALILLAATPQGRDAVSWAADLVGIGEVGGPPVSTLSEQAPEPSRDPIVFATGTAPDGQRFELFAYRSEDTEIHGGATCVQTKFLDSNLGVGALCFGDGPTEEGVGIREFSASELIGDYGLLGGEVSLAADRVVVDYRTAGGERRTAEATVADLDGELAQRIALPNPTSFFVALLPGAVESRELCDYAIEVTAFDGDGRRLASQSLDEPCRKHGAFERDRAVIELRLACKGENIERPIDELSEPCAQALRHLRASN